MRLTNLTSSSLLVAVLLTLGLTPNVQAQSLPIQSDQLAPSAVQPTDDAANALGQDLDTTLGNENNASFAEKASSPFAAEFFTRLNNVIQNAGEANSTPESGTPSPNTVDGIRGALEMQTLGGSAGESPVPASGASVAPAATSPAPNPVPSEIPASGSAPSPTNISPTSSGQPQAVPQTIPVPSIPLGNLAQ